MSGRITRGAVLAACVIALTGGCGPSDPWLQQVSAKSPTEFNIWQSRLAGKFSAADRTRIADALQEVRLQIMGERELRRAMDEPVISGSEAIESALRERVHGRPLREVLQLGYEIRVRRLSRELAGLEDAMKRNAGLVTKPGDVESKHHLEGLRDRQAARVAKYREDLAAAEKALAPLAKASGKTMLPPQEDVSPRALDSRR
jgi:hypothetical protein